MKNETNTTDTTKLADALALWLGCEASELEEARHDCYGLTVFEYGHDSYAIGTDQECDDAVASYIEETLWAFSPGFICRACKLPDGFATVLRSYQSKECENANGALLQIVNAMCDWEWFVREATLADGRGHFLASYDGEEMELGEGLFAYRIG